MLHRSGSSSVDTGVVVVEEEQATSLAVMGLPRKFSAHGMRNFSYSGTSPVRTSIQRKPLYPGHVIQTFHLTSVLKFSQSLFLIREVPLYFAV